MPRDPIGYAHALTTSTGLIVKSLQSKHSIAIRIFLKPIAYTMANYDFPHRSDMKRFWIKYERIMNLDITRIFHLPKARKSGKRIFIDSRTLNHENN